MKTNIGQQASAETVGVVFATTGKTYNILARRAARTMRQCMPDVQIDWFTDSTLEPDPVFNQIHKLSDSFFRPKMEALRKSRFDRTLYLDADIITLLNVSELFEALNDFDLLGAHAEKGTTGTPPKGEPPRCILPLNSGVLAIRKSEMMDAFLTQWEAEVRDNAERRDQPALRRVLVRSQLRFSVLGPEYNLMKHSLLENWGQRLGAPRIIHAPMLHDVRSGDPQKPFELEEVLSDEIADYVRKLMRLDRSIGGHPDAVSLTPRQKIGRKLETMTQRTAALQKDKKRLSAEKKRLQTEVSIYRKNRTVRFLTMINWRLRHALDKLPNR